jgi:hypothetical protein
MPLARLLRPALRGLGPALLQLVDELLHRVAIGKEFAGFRIDGGAERGH